MKKQSQAAGNPAIYVGTYGKYNSGSIDGKWVDLTDFSSKEDFFEHIQELHSDDPDPEFMFQDWENIPEWAIDESFISPAFWGYLEAIDRIGNEEAFKAYMDIGFKDMSDPSKVDWDEIADDFEERYHGEFKNDTDLAYEYVDSVGWEGISNKEFYFDREKFERDLGFDGWEEVDEEEASENPEDYPDGPGTYAQGEFYSESSISEIVDEWFDDEGTIGDETFQSYFDYENFGSDLSYDFAEDNGHYFFNH